MMKINRRNVRLADTLSPKRGKTEDYDPLVIIELWRADGKARVKDASLVSKDEGWAKNHVADRDGSHIVTLDELNRNYRITCEAGRPCWIEYLHIKYGGTYSEE